MEFFDIAIAAVSIRTILVLITGGSLSLAGSTYQAVFRNDLADPYLLGTSSITALVLLLTKIVHVDVLGDLIVLFVSSAASTAFALLLFVSTKSMLRLSGVSLIVAGVILNAFVTSLIFLTLFLFNENYNYILLLLYGDIDRHLGDGMFIPISLCALVICLLFITTRKLHIHHYDEEVVESIGIRVRRNKILNIALSSLLVSLVTYTVGIIGYIGIVVPNVVYRLFGYDRSSHYAVSFLFGGLFLYLADFFARILFSPSNVPVGIITGLVGAPISLLILNNALRREPDRTSTKERR